MERKKNESFSTRRRQNYCRKCINFSESLEVQNDFKFSWSKAKSGLIQFKNDYSDLVFKTQQMLGFGTSLNWEIKQLTFNKMILVQRNDEKNTLIEYHFEKDLRDNNVG